MWIDSRTCQKYRILLSARQRSNNYLELSKENLLGNMMLSHWIWCFTWKLFFMIWFHKILKLIFHKQPLSLNICTKYWRKPPLFTAFLEISYTFRTTILSNMCKNFVNCAIHSFPFYFNASGRSNLVDLVVLNFYFDIVRPFYFLKWNRCFQPVKVCQIYHVILESTS